MMWWCGCWGEGEDDDVEEENQSEDRKAHLVRACAVETHMDIWEGPLLCGNLEEEWRTQIPGTSFCASLRSRNAHGLLRRAILYGNWQEKCRTPIPRTLFCASLRSRNAHGHLRRAILYGNWQEKCRTPIPRTLFCASLRSRNAHGHLRRAILYRNLQEKRRTRMRTPRLKSPGFNEPFSVATVWGKRTAIQRDGLRFEIFRSKAVSLQDVTTDCHDRGICWDKTVRQTILFVSVGPRRLGFVERWRSNKVNGAFSLSMYFSLVFSIYSHSVAKPCKWNL